MSPPSADSRESPRRTARREALERRQRERHQRQEEVQKAPALEQMPPEPQELSLKKIGAPLARELIVYAGRRMALLKLEVTRLAGEADKDVAVLTVGAGGLALGYVMTTVGVALALGAWLGGTIGMGLGIAIVGFLHLAVGGLFAWRSYKHLSDGQWELAQTRAEFERDVKWLKEIKETPLLPAPEDDETPKQAP